MATQMKKLILPAIAEGTPIPGQFQSLVYVKFKAQSQLDAINTILQTLLNYESEQTKNKQAGAAILGILALLVIGSIANSKW